MRADIKGYFNREIEYEIEDRGAIIKIYNGKIELLYDNDQEKEHAQQLARAYFDAYKLRTLNDITARFDFTWENLENNKRNINIALSDTIRLDDDVSISLISGQKIITGTARIVTTETAKNASFENDSEMVQRAMKNEVLARSIGYFSSEVVGSSNPGPGIYNSIEVITDHLGGSKNGRIALAKLAGREPQFVDDLMQATQVARHPNVKTNVRLNNAEMIERARILIDAFSRHQ